MPFPKDTPRAEDKAGDQKGQKFMEYEGIDLLLKSYLIKPSRSFGHIVILECETEGGLEVRLTTFSEVVADQLEVIKGDIPCIITPNKPGDYYTIY